MVTGLTRSFSVCFDEITRFIDPRPDNILFGLTVMLVRRRTVFIADTTVNERPDPDQLADIAIQAAAQARRMGHETRIALLSFSNFGQPARDTHESLRAAEDRLAAPAQAGHGPFQYHREMTAGEATRQTRTS